MSWLAELNPDGHPCADCGEIADEYYDDEWLCEDCILLRHDEQRRNSE